MKRLASIDIGSNSMHLYVVDIDTTGSFHPVDLLRSSIRLGEGWTPDRQEISPEKIEAAISVLGGFVAKALLHDVDTILCSATAALREAENQEVFRGRLESELNLCLRVLSGVEEAAIVYRGTRAHLKGELLLFDLGGRSTELVYGTGPQPDACLSLPIGHLGLFSRCPTPQPATEEHWQALMATAMEEVQDLGPMAGAHCALSSPSGAVRTLARMAAFSRGEAPLGRGDGLWMTQAELDWVVFHLRSAKPDQLGNIPGIDPRRADTLLAAAAIVQAFMLRFSQSRVFAAPGGLRHGLLVVGAAPHKAG
jgi:exopolyphosphatase/guanosine-5'-triphosphate,3'-diphosphate pyrophosphatase